MFLLAMLIITLVWIVAACAFVGWGCLLKPLFINNRRDISLCCDLFWIGLVLVLTFLQIWNCFLPLDWRASVSVVLVGAMGLRRFPRIELKSITPKQRIFVGLTAVAIIWALTQCLTVPDAFDSGLYHFNSIRWLNEYAIVPGLGNLHARLAFNQSYFLYVAFLNVYPFFSHGHNVANGLLFTVVMVRFATGAISVFDGSRRASVGDVFRMLSFPVTWRFATMHSLSSPSPDYPMFLISIFLASELIDLLFCDQIEKRQPTKLFLLINLAVMAVSWKLSLAFFSFMTIVIVISFYLLRRKDGSFTMRREVWWVISIVPIILTVTWVVRGIISSGYPLFPCRLLSFPFDWRVPDWLAKKTADGIYIWARSPHALPEQVYGHWDWFKPWLKRIRHDGNIIPPLLWLLPSFGIAGMFAPWSLRRKKTWAPFIPSLASIVFWFMAAPDPRFAGAAFWILGLWSLTIATGLILDDSRIQIVVGCIFAVMLFGAIVDAGKKTSVAFITSTRGFCDLPIISMNECTTDSGFKIFIPVVGIQAWDYQLPCAHKFEERLEMRGKRLDEGFRIRSE